jgi:hypothetical protein
LITKTWLIALDFGIQNLHSSGFESDIDNVLGLNSSIDNTKT